MTDETRNAMLAAKEKITKDASCKAIFKDRFVLACLMKDLFGDTYKDISEHDIATKYIEPDSIREGVPISKNLSNIQGLSEEDLSLNEGDTRYDVIFKAKAPGKGDILVDLKINVEAQGNYNPGYSIPTRSIMYASRMLASEFGEFGNTIDYNNVYKVYSIWVCFNVSKRAKNSIAKIHMELENALGYTDDIEKSEYDLMETIILRLGDPNERTDSKAIDALNSIFFTFGKEREQRLKELDLDTPSIRKEVENMFNYAEVIEAYGENRGYEKAQEENEKKQRENVRALYKNGVSMKVIAESLCIPEEKVKDMLTVKLVGVNKM